MISEDNGVAETPTMKRIARVLASWQVSANAGGTSPSAGPDVDAGWPEQIEVAVALLKAMREPDADMAAIGDVAVWRRMIEAAILGRRHIDLPAPPEQRPTAIRDAGNAENLHDGAWTRRDERLDESFPASDPG
jgi:hypothetical protein